MPKAPLPRELESFVRAPRPAVVGTVRPDGTPATTATWYGWERDRLVLSMVEGSPRARNVRGNPHVSVTILGDNWYDHVTLLGHATMLREDGELSDLDELSLRYTGERYPKRDLSCVTALVEVERWHAWGNPGAAG